MGNFTRGDLKYDYDWTTSAGDNRKIIGFPDNILLNRNEGYEVLHFLNRYMEHRGWYGPNSFSKIEAYIHEKLPGNIRSHKKIQDHLDRYFKL
jgi:hypothetical protein